MKRSVISLGLLGGFLLITNLIFAQDIPPANTDNPTTINQADNNTEAAANQINDVPSNEADANAILPAGGQSNEQGILPADTQGNSDTTTAPADQTNTDVASNSSDVQDNFDAGPMPADTQANSDTTTAPADQTNTDVASNPSDAQANTDNAASNSGAAGTY